MIHSYDNASIWTQNACNRIVYAPQMVLMNECPLMLNTGTNAHVFVHSDSVEQESTLSDNTIQLQSIVQYEPDLFITRLVIYYL